MTEEAQTEAETAAEGATETKGKRGKGARAEAKTPASPHDVLYNASRLAGAFESLLKGGSPSLTLSQWSMLATLGRDDDGNARPSQVSKRLGASRQSVRQTVKKLTSLGLVEGEAAEEGKKAVGLKLTDAGKAKLDEITALTEGASGAIKSGKRGNALDGVVKALRAMATGLTEQTPKGEKKGKGKGKGKRKEGAETAAAETEAETEAA